MFFSEVILVKYFHCTIKKAGIILVDFVCHPQQLLSSVVLAHGQVSDAQVHAFCLTCTWSAHLV